MGWGERLALQKSKEHVNRLQFEEEKLAQSTDRPNIILEGVNIIKTTPEIKAQLGFDAPYVIQFNLINNGAHTAINLEDVNIFVDKDFQDKPRILHGSLSNDIPVNYSFPLYIGFKFPPALPPCYMVYAIKYNDKATSNLKKYTQIWYYKNRGSNDIEKEPPPFYPATIPEKEDILIHYKKELKDYIETQ